MTAFLLSQVQPLETFFNVSEETRLFLLCAVLGAVLGIAYDVFRAVRALIPHRPVFVALEDIVFFCLWGIELAAFSTGPGRGAFRFYFFAGNALGFALYYFTLGFLTFHLFQWVLGGIQKIVRMIFSFFKRLLLRPFGAVFHFFSRLLAQWKNIGIRKKLQKAPSKHLQVEPGMMYNRKEHSLRTKGIRGRFPKKVRSVSPPSSPQKGKGSREPPARACASRPGSASSGK